MRRLFLVTALLAGFIIRSELCFGQVPLAANRVSALKGLRSLDVVIRPNTPKEVATVMGRYGHGRIGSKGSVGQHIGFNKFTKCCVA
jgi:hypothetical protein